MDVNAVNRFITTSEPGRFLQEQTVLSNSLVILDLDDTTITTPEGQWLGRSEMFYDYFARAQKNNPEASKEQLAEVIDPLLSAVYGRVPVMVTDLLLPTQIASLQEQDVTVIAMTARGKKISDITHQQLNWVRVKFSNIGKARSITIDSEREIMIEPDGVVMVGQGNTKGEALLALLNEGTIKMPEHIMLIDDREGHLHNVSQALEKNYPTIKYQPVLCTYLDGKKKYNPEEADRQLIDFLTEKSNDKVIKKLINEDNYTRNILRSCFQLIPDKKQACEKLLNAGFSKGI